jgi:hypothetical protein
MKTLFLILALAANSARAGETTLTVDVDKPGMKVSPPVYGIFFEEINRAGDGGLYAEMSRNRSFEDADKPDAWTGGTLDKSVPLNANNPTGLRIDGRVANEGFRGIAVQQGNTYRLSLYARGEGEWTAEQAGAEGKLTGVGEGWKKFETTLTPARNGTEVWVKPFREGGSAVGLFNRSASAQQVELNWKDAGLTGRQSLFDVWSHKHLGAHEGDSSVEVPAHGAVLPGPTGETSFRDT